MTHTYSVDVNGKMKADSTTNNVQVHSTNGCINGNLKQEFEHGISYDVNQQKEHVYKMHNYCCNPEQLKRKCRENYNKLLVKKKELGSAKRKIKVLKKRVAFLQDVIKNLKQSKNEVKDEQESL